MEYAPEANQGQAGRMTSNERGSADKVLFYRHSEKHFDM